MFFDFREFHGQVQERFVGYVDYMAGVESHEGRCQKRAQPSFGGVFDGV